jgi:Icc-related predicted phosphoesterase
MRFLLVSDLHYRLRQFDWLAAVADTVDAVVIAGDLLDIRSPVSLHVQTMSVTAALKNLGARTLVLCASGNHDLDGRDLAGEKVAGWLKAAKADGVHLDGESLVVAGNLFTICPWWDGPIGRTELGEHLASEAMRPRRRWIWVYHAPPSGSPLSWDGRRAFGDEILSQWISRFHPDLVLVGHVHQAPFVPGGAWSDRIGPTWVFNAGRQIGAVPAHILIDLDEQTAVWTSATDRQCVHIGSPAATGPAGPASCGS